MQSLADASTPSLLTPHSAGVNLEKYTHMHELLGPAEAAHGFPTAHAILKHKPDIAKELWFPPDTQVLVDDKNKPTENGLLSY